MVDLLPRNPSRKTTIATATPTWSAEGSFYSYSFVLPHTVDINKTVFIPRFSGHVGAWKGSGFEIIDGDTVKFWQYSNTPIYDLTLEIVEGYSSVQHVSVSGLNSSGLKTDLLSQLKDFETARVVINHAGSISMGSSSGQIYGIYNAKATDSTTLSFDYIHRSGTATAHFQIYEA